MKAAPDYSSSSEPALIRWWYMLQFKPVWAFTLAFELGVPALRGAGYVYRHFIGCREADVIILLGQIKDDLAGYYWHLGFTLRDFRNASLLEYFI